MLRAAAVRDLPRSAVGSFDLCGISFAWRSSLIQWTGQPRAASRISSRGTFSKCGDMAFHRVSNSDDPGARHWRTLIRGLSWTVSSLYDGISVGWACGDLHYVHPVEWNSASAGAGKSVDSSCRISIYQTAESNIGFDLAGSIRRFAGRCGGSAPGLRTRNSPHRTLGARIIADRSGGGGRGDGNIAGISSA